MHRWKDDKVNELIGWRTDENNVIEKGNIGQGGNRRRLE